MKYQSLGLLLILFFFSCDDIIEVEDISEEEVVVLAPTHNAILSTQDVIFSWELIEEAAAYKLQIATPNFTEAIQIVGDTTVTALNFIKTLELGDYEWRVRAENSGYHTQYTTQKFTIEE